MSGVFDDDTDNRQELISDTEARLIEDARFAIDKVLPTLQAARVTQTPRVMRHRAPYALTAIEQANGQAIHLQLVRT